MRFREDNPEDLDWARTAVAQWREKNPAGTEDQLLTALGPQFHRDYTPVLRAVLFTHDRKSPPSPPAREEHPGSPQAHPEPADRRKDRDRERDRPAASIPDTEDDNVRADEATPGARRKTRHGNAASLLPPARGAE